MTQNHDNAHRVRLAFEGDCRMPDGDLEWVPAGFPTKGHPQLGDAVDVGLFLELAAAPAMSVLALDTSAMVVVVAAGDPLVHGDRSTYPTSSTVPFRVRRESTRIGRRSGRSRALLLEGAGCRDLTLFDAVSGGEWERGLFQLILEHADVFDQLPEYAHEALVASHMRQATHVGYRAGVLDAFLEPWRGPAGRAAFCSPTSPPLSRPGDTWMRHPHHA